MRFSVHVAARLLALSAILTLGITGVAGAHAGNPVVGHLYVNDNTAVANTIAGYDRHADGSLTPIPGSPFGTGGAGTGAAIGSQGALQTARHGRFVLAVDAGSNQISVLRVGDDGALTVVPGGTVSSGGSQPVSLAVARHRVYVANAGTGASNYTGFHLSDDGILTPLADTTVSLPDGSQPGDVLVNGDGTTLAGTRVGTSLIDSFSIGRQGRLSAAPGSPYAAQAAGPFGSEFRPTDPDQLFVSNAHGGADAGSVSAYTVGGAGQLASIGTSPFANHQTAPCWIEISHDGRVLFTVNTAVPSLSSYAIDRGGSLQLIANTPFPGPASGLGPEDARLTPDGSTLWVVDSKADALSAFRVRGGRLTALTDAPVPLPAGASPFGIVTS